MGHVVRRATEPGGTSALAMTMAPPWLVLGVVPPLLLAIILSHWTLLRVWPGARVAHVTLELQTTQRWNAAFGLHEWGMGQDELAYAPVAAPWQARSSALASRWPLPYAGGRPLHERFPSLVNWYHPVTGSAELTPSSPSRVFGASRPSLPFLRWECGMGHCGVDLDGPRGRPLVAVAAGRVVRVERSELGRDGRSGRYVRIEHDDGTLTAYMHMDDIADDVDVGVRVAAGQFIGTLGATAVFQSAPHCHFTLEVPRTGRPGDISNTNYVDPAPFLVRSTVLTSPRYEPRRWW